MRVDEQHHAIVILQQDHRKLNDLFATFQESDGLTEQKETVHVLMEELKSHLQLEEQIIYPALKEAAAAWVDQAQEDDQDIAAVMEDLLDIEPKDPLFKDKVMELKDKVHHHIQQAESEMFPQAEEMNLNMNELGMALLDLRRELSNQYAIASRLRDENPKQKKRQDMDKRKRRAG